MRMENVTVSIDESPTDDQIAGAGLDPACETLFGLYDGAPLSDRGHDFGMQLPDRILLFYRPLVDAFRSPTELREEIRRTVMHEIAHFLGLGEDEIERLGY